MKYYSPQQFKSAAKKGEAGDCVIRKLAVGVPEDDSDRRVKFTISTDAIDRDHDKIDQKGWKLDNYNKNPVVLWSHQGSEPPIGKVVGIGVEDGKLKATVEFVPADNPFVGAKAEGVYQMCKSGFVNATSVGFSPIEYELSEDKARGGETWSPGVDFKKQELFELSIVPIPANPQALIEGLSLLADPKAIQEDAQPPAPPASLNNGKASRARIVRFLELSIGATH